MITKLEKIAYVLLCILMIDCSIFGGGRLISFGPITFRMAIIISLLICSIPIMLKNFKQLFKNKYFLSVILFACCVVIMMVVGFVNGHRSHLILTDLKGFMYFVPLPAMMCLLNSKKRIYTLMKSLLYANFVASIAGIVFLFIYVYDAPIFNELNVYLRDMQVTYAGGVTPTILRMFYRSALYLLCGCAFSMYFYIKEEKNWKYPIISGFSLFGILITYTRSFYLAAAITAFGIIVFVVLEKKNIVKALCFLGKTVVMFACLLLIIGGVNKTNYLEFAITRTANTFPLEGESTENTFPSEEESTENTEMSDNEEGIKDYIEATKKSDEYRDMTIRGLIRNIKKSPLFGLGLGAEFKERPDGLNEYIYLDIWSKMGIIGLALYFMPLILAIISFDKHKQYLLTRGSYVMYVAMVLIGFMSYSLFNPFMNASVGVLYYCCVLAVVNYWEKTVVKEN